MKRHRLTLAVAVVAGLSWGSGFAEASNARHADSGNAQAEARQLPGADKSGAAETLAERWSATADGRGYKLESWRSELVAAVERGSAEAVTAALEADSYSEVIRALSGRNADVLQNESPLALGANASGLVFYPITPCRILDTRFGASVYTGVRTNGQVTNIRLSGQNVAQGGNPAGCPEIPAEPGAIAFTLTVVDYGTNGFVTAYPFGAVRPNASTINYGPGSAPNPIANSSVVQVCYSCGDDVAFYVEGGSTNLIVDVIGYYNPDEDTPFGTSKLTSILLAAGNNYMFSGTVIAPDRPMSCQVTANVLFDSAAPNATGALQTGMRTALRTLPSSNANDTGYYHYLGSNGDDAGSASSSANWELSAGSTYQFGCFVIAAGDWIGDNAYCDVSWDCR